MIILIIIPHPTLKANQITFHGDGKFHHRLAVFLIHLEPPRTITMLKATPTGEKTTELVNKSTKKAIEMKIIRDLR